MEPVEKYSCSKELFEDTFEDFDTRMARFEAMERDNKKLVGLLNDLVPTSTSKYKYHHTGFIEGLMQSVLDSLEVKYE